MSGNIHANDNTGEVSRDTTTTTNVEELVQETSVKICPHGTFSREKDGIEISGIQPGQTAKKGKVVRLFDLRRGVDRVMLCTHNGLCKFNWTI